MAVDLVIFTILDADLEVLLSDRIEEPFAGHPALPGGFVRVGDSYEDQGEDLDEAVLRELEEETGLPRGSVYFEQLRTYGKAGRDPRMRVFIGGARGARATRPGTAHDGRWGCSRRALGVGSARAARESVV